MIVDRFTLTTERLLLAVLKSIQGQQKKGLIFLLLVSREASKGLAGFRATFGRVEVELESNTLLELLQRVSLRVVVLLLRVAWEGES